MILILVKGLGIGFISAVILGPIGILCMQKTIAQGQRMGLAVGLGAALGDATYGAIAGFGMTAVSNFMIDHQLHFRIIGGLFLLYLGIRSFYRDTASETIKLKSSSRAKTAFTSYFLTLTNPITILTFAAIFAGLGLSQSSFFTALILIVGVFVGSISWFIIFTTLVSFFHVKLTREYLPLINRLSGTIIVGFGVLSIVSLFFKVIQ